MVYNFIVQALLKYSFRVLAAIESLFNKIKTSRKILLLITLVFFIPVFLIYFKESVSFHFIDEYNNFLAGYFLLKGKVLYSQIFFQHQPILAYASYLLQEVTNPTTLYKLVVYHRMFVVLVALLFGLLLVFRFRLIGLGFVFIFELTKYYVFGSTFLAESFVVYPLVYLLGVAWDILHKRKISQWDMWLGSVLTWFVIFMREPYIPTAIFLYIILLTAKQPTKTKIGATLILIVLSALVVLPLPIPDYLFEIITVNAIAVASGEIHTSNLMGPGLLAIFMYPLLILFQGFINYFRGVLVVLDLIFLFTFYLYIVSAKQWKNGLIILFILGISNIRIMTPGTVFFGAYHMIVWYGLFIIATLLLVDNLFKTKQYASRLITASLMIVLGLYIVLPTNSFLWTKLDKQTTFNTNYGNYYSNGEVVQELANSRTTFFVDGWDSLVYWQADQRISYPFLFYYPPMQNFPRYTDTRAKMFRESPPQFVYTGCKLIKGTLTTDTFHENITKDYRAFYSGKSPTCLFIKKSTVNTVTKEQWDNIEKFGYHLKD